jgi:signal transduction histidine kinase
LDARSLPDAITGEDFHLFNELVGLAADVLALNDLLLMLQTYLGVPALLFNPIDQPPPAGDRLVIMPLEQARHHLGDLCLELPPDADSTTMASRLSFFAPLVVLVARNGPDVLYTTLNERDRLEAILEATNDALLMVDTDDRVVLVTLQFETFTGIPRYEILGSGVDRLADRIEIQPGLPPQLANILHTSAGSYTDSAGGEFEVTAPQRRILVWYSLPVYAQSGFLLGRVFVFRDTTRERELDRMKIEFVTLVSHELRTPLTSVKGFSDLILENETRVLDGETREYLQIISQNADRLIKLLNDIMDITRIETDRIELKPESCPLEEVIGQVAISLQPVLNERGHKLKLEFEPKLPPVWADRARMGQIVTNLLTNAIKYTLDPGQITVRAVFLRQPDSIPAGAGRDLILPCVLVSVQDTGVGISSEDQAHLFERFYRAKSEASRLIGGTGLGLTIVKSFVEMQGGRVWFETTPGVGSTFYFTVPVGSTSEPV